MKEIVLTQGYIALVDDEDYLELIKFKWRRDTNNYARTASMVLMHRFIMKPQGQIIDHIDGNRLNNQKVNLRLCNQSENLCNRPKQLNNTSGYKGVHWHIKRGCWQANIKINQVQIYLGSFKTKEDAALAYNEASIKYHKEFAYINIINTI